MKKREDGRVSDSKACAADAGTKAGKEMFGMARDSDNSTEREQAWKPTVLEVTYLLSHPMLSSSISTLGLHDIIRRRDINRRTVLGFAVEDGAAYITELDLSSRVQAPKYWATRDECLQALLGDTFE